MKRIAILSDVHGNYDKLVAVANRAEQLGAEAYIFLGDLLVGGDQPLKCFEFLESLNVCTWIRGNTDDWILNSEKRLEAVKKGYFEEKEPYLTCLNIAQKSFLQEKPIYQVISVENVKIGCFHGTPYSNEKSMMAFINGEDIENSGLNAMLFGHTHIAQLSEASGVTFFNPGSAGIPDTEGDISFGMMEIDKDDIRITIEKIRVIDSMQNI